MTTPNTPQNTEIALLRSELLLPLTRIEGDVRLVLQRLDQSDQRAAEHAAELRRLDERQDILDRDLVPRAEIEGIRTALLTEFRREIAALKADDTSSKARAISIISVVVAVAGVVVALLALVLN